MPDSSTWALASRDKAPIAAAPAPIANAPVNSPRFETSFIVVLLYSVENDLSLSHEPELGLEMGIGVVGHARYREDQDEIGQRDRRQHLDRLPPPVYDLQPGLKESGAARHPD